MPLSVAAWSVLSTASERTVYDICILHDAIPEAEQKKLKSLLARAGTRHSVRFINLDTVFGKYLKIDESKWTTKNWPRAAWGRIAVTDLLPDADRVIYLDIDVLVCTDLSPLFNADMGDAALGVVFERESCEGSHFNKRFEIPLNCPGYFNSGVLLMNLAVFRRDDLVKKVMDYAWTHSDVLTCPDQDALNGALCDRLYRLHPRWNWHDGLTRYIFKWNPASRIWRGNSPKASVGAALYPGVLHYQGVHKPWRYNYRIERARYERAMLDVGIIDHLPLPGWNFETFIKRLVYAPLYAVTWWKIRRLAKRFNITRAPLKYFEP